MFAVLCEAGTILSHDEPESITDVGIEMVASMTAFARLEGEGHWGRAIWEIRTVNHRYLDTSLRLPEEFRTLEATIREHISAKLSRGKVDCHLRYETHTTRNEICINAPLAKQLIHAADSLNIAGDPSINPLDILRWPGVIEKKTTDPDTLRGPVITLLDETLDIITSDRQREGEKIKALIDARCDQSLAHVAFVRAQIPDIMHGIKARYLARANAGKVDLDQDRLEQEMLLLSQRLDVAEELDRLEAHIHEVKRVLHGAVPIGRRLDFLMQEINREANTLGSKSAHIDTSNTAVELKVLIEQMREHIQNIE